MVPGTESVTVEASAKTRKNLDAVIVDLGSRKKKSSDPVLPSGTLKNRLSLERVQKFRLMGDFAIARGRGSGATKE